MVQAGGPVPAPPARNSGSRPAGHSGGLPGGDGREWGLGDKRRRKEPPGVWKG